MRRSGRRVVREPSVDPEVCCTQRGIQHEHALDCGFDIERGLRRQNMWQRSCLCSDRHHERADYAVACEERSARLRRRRIRQQRVLERRKQRGVTCTRVERAHEGHDEQRPEILRQRQRNSGG